MKKSDIKARLDTLQRAITTAEAAFKRATTIQKDIERFEAEIERIGEPEYTDDKAIQRLATAKLKLDLARKASEGASEKEAGAHDALFAVAEHASYLAKTVLTPIVENRLRTIASSLMMFSADERSAEGVAKKTDAYRGAEHAVYQLSSSFALGSRMHGHSIEGALRGAKQIEEILLTALKPVPDLVRFLPMKPGGAEEAPAPQPVAFAAEETDSPATAATEEDAATGTTDADSPTEEEIESWISAHIGNVTWGGPAGTEEEARAAAREEAIAAIREARAANGRFDH